MRSSDAYGTISTSPRRDSSERSRQGTMTHGYSCKAGREMTKDEKNPAIGGLGRVVANALDRDNALLQAAGRRFEGVRAGADRRAATDPRLAGPQTIELVSDLFTDGHPLPSICVGKDAVFPDLRWRGASVYAMSFVLIVEDIDVPAPEPLCHALVVGIPPLRRSLPQGGVPTIAKPGAPPADVRLGKSAGGLGYQPPTPLPGHGMHRYVFQLFAIDREEAPPAGAGREQAIAAIAGSVISWGELIGTAAHP